MAPSALAGTQDAPLFAGSQGRWQSGGWVGPQIKQKALDATSYSTLLPQSASNNLGNMFRRVLRVATIWVRTQDSGPTKMRASLGGCWDFQLPKCWGAPVGWLPKQKPKVMPKMIFFIIKHNNVVIIFMIAAARSFCSFRFRSLLLPRTEFLGDGAAFIRLVCLCWACGLWGFGQA